MEALGIDAVADRLDHPTTAQLEPARGRRVFLGLGQQDVGDAAANPFDGDENSALPRRHMVMKIEAVRGVGDGGNTGAPGGNAADQRGDGGVDVNQIEAFAPHDAAQRVIGAPMAAQAEQGAGEGNRLDPNPLIAGARGVGTIGAGDDDIVAGVSDTVDQRQEKMVEGEIHRADLENFHRKLYASANRSYHA